MNGAKGLVWHKKQKGQSIMPKGLRGIDKEATWCKSQAAGCQNLQHELRGVVTFFGMVNKGRCPTAVWCMIELVY